MRLPQDIHDALPLHAAGSEIYTAHLSRALADAGHELAVFTCEERRELPQYTLLRRTHDGLPVYEGIYNRIYHDLSEQWDDPRMAVVFGQVLDEFRPDAVHVQGLQFVGGVSSLAAAAARGLPVIMTLHEYWWLCPRAGLMYDLDGRACERATPVDCARCVDVYPIDRQRWSDAAHHGSHAALGDRRWFARALEGRAADLAAAVAHVDRFIAPSHFLAQRFREAGVPGDKLVVADYGFPAPPPRRPARRPAGGPLRAGYVGTLSDYKGVLVFARAVAQSGLPRSRLLAPVHGHLDWFPEIAAELRRVAATTPALELRGPFPPGRREEVFAELDLLVVPSLWWENSPLTIHEAFQRGVPVLTSARGGMAELVARGGGETFPPGDAAALAQKLVLHADQPARIDALAAAIPPVRALSEDVALVERLLAEAAAMRGSRTGRLPG